LDRAREIPSRANCLGRSCVDVCTLPPSPALGKGSKINHVQAATGKYLYNFVLEMANISQNGSWAQEAIEGVFNKTVAIGYPNFKFSFTIWMLGQAHKYLQELS
jgi:hypothetical protein